MLESKIILYFLICDLVRCLVMGPIDTEAELQRHLHMHKTMFKYKRNANGTLTRVQPCWILLDLFVPSNPFTRAHSYPMYFSQPYIIQAWKPSYNCGEPLDMDNMVHINIILSQSIIIKIKKIFITKNCNIYHHKV